MIDLGTLGGSSSHAAAVNGAGQVVGSSTVADGSEHVFSWTQAGGMIDLGTRQARLALARANCTVGGPRRVYSHKPSGSVLAQKPKPWTRLEAGARVQLTVSKGRRPAHRPK
jgi:probable HAF family extracellular repeat protein